MFWSIEELYPYKQFPSTPRRQNLPQISCQRKAQGKTVWGARDGKGGTGAELVSDRQTMLDSLRRSGTVETTQQEDTYHPHTFL